MTYIHHPTNYQTTNTTTLPLPWIIVIVVLGVLSLSLSLWHLWYRHEYEREYRAVINREPDLTREGFKARCKENKWRPWKRAGGDFYRPASQMERCDVESGVDERNSVGKPNPMLGFAYGNTRLASPYPSPQLTAEPSPLLGAPHSTPLLSPGRAASPMLGSAENWRSTENGMMSRGSIELSERHNSRIITLEDIHAAQGLGLAPEVEPAPVSRCKECDLKDPPPAYAPVSAVTLHVSGGVRDTCLGSV